MRGKRRGTRFASHDSWSQRSKRSRSRETPFGTTSVERSVVGVRFGGSHPPNLTRWARSPLDRANGKKKTRARTVWLQGELLGSAWERWSQADAWLPPELLAPVLGLKLIRDQNGSNTPTRSHVRRGAGSERRKEVVGAPDHHGPRMGRIPMHRCFGPSPSLSRPRGTGTGRVQMARPSLKHRSEPC